MAEKKYTVLFLDIDGVCNHSEKAETLYDGDYRNTRLIEPRVPLCKDNVRALMSIIAKTENPAVVWSTDWRFAGDDTWNGWINPLRWLEERCGLKKYVIGATPKKLSSNRHEEIMMWFDDQTVPFTRNFAVFDDIEYGMDIFGDHFFGCGYREGLTEKTAAAAVRFLSVPSADIKEYRKIFK